LWKVLQEGKERGMTNRLKIGQEVLIHGYVDEIRKDTIIIQNDGGYFGTVEYEVTDIEMPNTNEVLDKIRAEIDRIEINGQEDEHTMFIRTGENVKQMALDIIDKYRKEQNDW
jgi:hypothetical protein